MATAPAHAHPLSHLEIGDATVYPELTDHRYPGWVFSGVAQDGRFVPGTVLERGGNTHPRAMRYAFPPEPVVASAATRPVDASHAGKTAIYMGRVDAMYGHFILESLSRLWYALRHPDLPLVWSVPEDDTAAPLKDFQKEILDALGVENEVILVSTPTLIGNLHIPDVGYRMDDYLHPEQVRALARFVGPKQEPGFNVWLSRSMSKKRSRALNDTAVERRLAQNGWTVVNPESLTLREQLETLSRASRVAGPEGSAFHTLMMLEIPRDEPPKQIDVFVRHERWHGAFAQQFSAMENVEVRSHVLAQELILRKVGASVEKISHNASETLNALGVPVTPEPFVAPDDALLELIQNALPKRTQEASYIEFGVRDGGTIAHVRAWRKTSVCRSFAFDPRAIEVEPLSPDEPSFRFYEIDSDTFRTYYPSAGQYDVVRVAALGERLPETLKQAQVYAKPDATWIIHTEGDESLSAIELLREPGGHNLSRYLTSSGHIYVLSRSDNPRQALDELDPPALPLNPSRPRPAYASTRAWRRAASWGARDPRISELVSILEALPPQSTPLPEVKARINQLASGTTPKYLLFTAVNHFSLNGSPASEWLSDTNLQAYDEWLRARQDDALAMNIASNWATTEHVAGADGVDPTVGMRYALVRDLLKLLRAESRS
ncbi:hypothetical protein DNL40_05375 [Xylanimonas oleitrophica]|uniref:Glycosyltransferase 61 catalytic domain-containing protein n=1 Tax=Xylanimonas oleitrophica TaxID=2607479 RepID=A0A2W5YHD2_9MICO|nr:glycosyltransferase 61 family protein [Xylanimonas oleitrophica]PZR54331.1 hypothetical protein DNL40_05375 [Xylanimonas oleitrophica]